MIVWVECPYCMQMTSEIVEMSVDEKVPERVMIQCLECSRQIILLVSVMIEYSP